MGLRVLLLLIDLLILDSLGSHADIWNVDWVPYINLTFLPLGIQGGISWTKNEYVVYPSFKFKFCPLTMCMTLNTSL